MSYYYNSHVFSLCLRNEKCQRLMTRWWRNNISYILFDCVHVCLSPPLWQHEPLHYTLAIYVQLYTCSNLTCTTRHHFIMYTHTHDCFSWGLHAHTHFQLHLHSQCHNIFSKWISPPTHMIESARIHLVSQYSVYSIACCTSKINLSYVSAWLQKFHNLICMQWFILK